MKQYHGKQQSLTSCQGLTALTLRYFWKMNTIFSSPPFYTAYVRLPTADTEVLPHIQNNPKFWPFFKDCLGAIDGSHIHSAPSSSE